MLQRKAYQKLLDWKKDRNHKALCILGARQIGKTTLIRKFGKRNIALAGSCIALGGQLLFFLNPYSLPWTVMSCLARAVGLAPLNAVVFGMIGDVVEFGQWKTHVRQKSLIFAGGSIGTKVGAGDTDPETCTVIRRNFPWKMCRCGAGRSERLLSYFYLRIG